MNIQPPMGAPCFHICLRWTGAPGAKAPYLNCNNVRPLDVVPEECGVIVGEPGQSQLIIGRGGSVSVREAMQIQ